MNLRKNIIKEVKNIKKNIKEDQKPIGIQIPEGLKQYSLMILDEFKEYDPLLFVDPCYGACDTKDYESRLMNCNMLIHFGHYKMYNTKIESIFVPLEYDLTLKDIKYITKEINKLDLKKINLVSTIQYLKNITDIKKELKKKDIKVANARKTNRVKKHMVLGCDISTIKNKDLPTVFIGDGYFHVNQIAFSTKSEVYRISPINKKIEKINIQEKFKRKRYALIAKAQKAQKFGILVSSKKGQNRIKLAKKIKEKIEKKLKKKAYILVSDYIKNNYLKGIKVDAYINTACPRITYDDYNNFSKPLLSTREVDLLVDLNKELKIDFIS